MIGKTKAVDDRNSTANNRQRGWVLGALLVLALLGLFFTAPIVVTSQALPAAITVGNEMDQVASVASAPQAPQAPQAMTTTITLKVINARTEPRAFDGAGVTAGEVITSPYRFLINVDNTGDPFDTTHCFAYTDPPTNTIRDPLYPDECDWPGVRTVPGWAPVYTQGNQDDLNETVGIDLPPGNYLISVMADGYKVDGVHFTVPLEEPGLLTVAAHPLPLPPATMVIRVFDDRAMTNGQFDAPGEQGLEGFRASINDIAGEITNDIFGNPICSEYERDINGDIILDPEGNPIPIPGTGGECLSDADGNIVIPFLGPLRYDVLVIPPDGEDWVQTTTLEGSQGWDTWLQEAGTGLDNEFIVAGEPFPWTIFGFVAPTDTLTVTAPENGSITGVIMASSTYVPSQGGLLHTGDIWGGLMGTKLERPIAYPWLALNDLQNGDQAVWVGRGEVDGSFTIPNVPPGDYSLTYWDEKQHFILDFVQLTVSPGDETDIGVRTMVGWFSEWSGYVFLDSNENGRRDPGEPGVPDYLVVMRDRDNTEIDRMSISAFTDENGFYELEKGYPMTFWMVLEAYSDIYHTTGVTFQASNQPEETTILGNGVDVSILPILSQWGRLDWGVKPYGPGTNGGIAGSVFYDTVRAEDDAAYAGAEPWQPGIPDLEMRLYGTVPCGTTPGADCDATGMYELAPDGSYAKGYLLNTTTTEHYVRPKDCVVRDVNGDPIDIPSLPPSTGGYDCLEAPLTGIQFGTEWTELPGNWGFGEVLTDVVTGLPLPSPAPIPPGNYLVEVVVPDDPVFGQPLFTPTREEDLNMFDGDVFYPAVPPSACAGPWHIVDVEGVGTDGYDIWWTSVTTDTSTPVYNPNFAAAGGSRFEGQVKPLCNVKLVNVGTQKGVAPIFQLWTEVPIPGRWRGYVIDDLNLATDPMNLTFGEKLGIAHSPVGIYDFTGRLVHTMHSDYHGVFEVLLPSDATYNAPSPSGMLANVYYIYGNDPGQPGNLNANYNPQYRSIGTSFEIYPGNIMPADLAPIQNGVGIWRPGSQTSQLAQCDLYTTTPQIFAVNKPYLSAGETLTITGTGFGTIPWPFGAVYLGSTRLSFLNLISWADREIVVQVPATMFPGPKQLSVLAGNRQSTVNGLTIHVLGGAYTPPVLEVGPGKTYDTIQGALDAAAGSGYSLVVVYPAATSPFTNPLGIWYENPIIYSPVILQGVGPGGVYSDGSGVLGSILDGRAVGGDTAYATQWRTTIGDIWLNRGGWDGSPVDGDGNPQIYEGPVVTVLAEDGEFSRFFPVTIDGFTIQGGDQQGVPNNLDQNGGGIIPGVPAQVVVQGGGVFVNAYARYMRITNNVVRSNGGAYAGAIRVGTPDLPPPFTDAQNDSLTISHNRILANGGTNLAGAIGLFNGTQNYIVSYNDICGNFSAEYGGGISHYGYSPGGAIHHNRIYFNRSYDEGGGIMIAGALPADPDTLSAGAGYVNVYNNQIQANLGNDDGGGLRFLMAGDFPFNVYNNFIANNISTHEGGGISLNDAPDVRIYNNTVVKNLTTATAATSNGQAAPAGLSSSPNSTLLQATLPITAPTFSDPILFNNIFWDNRAGSWTGGGVAGIGQDGDPNPIYHWDLGIASTGDLLSPRYSLLQAAYAGADGTDVIGSDPLFVEQYDVGVRVYPWRGNPAFIGAEIVAVDLPPNLLGNYHLSAGSPAQNIGIDSLAGILAPSRDYDDGLRPVHGFWDAGADESIIEP